MLFNFQWNNKKKNKKKKKKNKKKKKKKKKNGQAHITALRACSLK